MERCNSINKEGAKEVALRISCFKTLTQLELNLR